jgi:putative ABC transport system permease protein
MTADNDLAGPRPNDGGVPARRAVFRWAWRLFRREWRQHLLILGLIVAAVAATIVAAAITTETPPPADAGYGTAGVMAALAGTDDHLPAQLTRLRGEFGTVEEIANETLPIAGSLNTFELRAQDPHGPFGQPMLELLSGHYPQRADEIDVTPTLAAQFSLHLGSRWRVAGRTWTVVGTVDNPQNLLDAFALTEPGQVGAPSQVTLLFNARRGVSPATIGPGTQSVTLAADSNNSNVINPETMTIAALVLGMLLITLMAIGGFTVLAHRRQRSLGMLAAIGTTDRLVGMVMRADGLIVGALGAAVGTGLGLAGWFAYRPHLVAAAHHRIGIVQLPWDVVGIAIVLAVLSAYVAAARPAWELRRNPIVAALAGRPAPVRPIHRSAIPGVGLLVASFVLFGMSGATVGTGGSNGPLLLGLGLVCLVAALILLSPFALTALSRLGARFPVAVRLALRDLARYRARSGSALAAIAVSILIATIVVLAAAARYSNPLDYVGPNLAGNQIVLYTAANGAPHAKSPSQPTQKDEHYSLSGMTRAAGQIAGILGSRHVARLYTVDAGLRHAGAGRNWNGPIYLATPQLLKLYGITAGEISPNADLLSMRPGLSSASGLRLVFGHYRAQQGPPSRQATSPCPPRTCIAQPSIQEISALPSGTDAPNTVFTARAVSSLHLHPSLAGWIVQTTRTVTPYQLRQAEGTAGPAGLTVESKNDEPSSAQVLDTATVFGIALALAILAMSLGLVRSESGRDLKTLSAMGATGLTRRTITATTAGGLALLGAVLGAGGGYLAIAGWIRTSSLNGGIAALGNVPVGHLVAILIGMPVTAAVAAWLLGGRDLPRISRQPVE